MIYLKNVVYSNSMKISPIEKLAIRATRWIGSTQSIITHTIIFIASFLIILAGVPRDTVLLVLTTIVSLEAIYLSIFIQMSVNRSERRIRNVSKEIAEISEDVEEIHEGVQEIEKDIDEIQKDVDEIQEDVEGIEKDIDEIQEDVEEIEKDIDEIQEDVDEIQEDVDDIEQVKSKSDQNRDKKLEDIQEILRGLLEQINQLKK